MGCMYTAQGEFLCRPNVEKYEDSPVEEFANNYDCYGVKVSKASDCDTCGKVKKVYQEAKKTFDARSIEACKNPKGSWSQTCDKGSVNKHGVYSTKCTGKISTNLNLTTCPKGTMWNNLGKLKCDQ
jgi:serine protease inhibitor